MSLAAQIASIVAGATALGGGLYKLGTGLVAMSEAVKHLTGLAADHEDRLRALEAVPAKTS